MKKETFELLAKTYLRNFARNEFTADELVGLLRLSEQRLSKPAMFRFGKDSTILYTVNEIEQDLMYSTQTNRDLLKESIEYACNKNEIIIY